MKKHTDTLKEIFKDKKLSYVGLATELGLTSSTVRKKFDSENVNSIIDFLMALGLKIIDEEGNDILTGNQELIKLENVYIKKADFERFKELLDKKE